MPEDKVLGIFRALLMHLKEAKSKPGSSLDKAGLFRKIEDDIQFVREVLTNVERWGNDVQDGLEDIVKRFDVLLENSGSKDEIPSLELEAIDRMTSVLKKGMTPPVHLSETEFIGPMPSTANNDPDQKLVSDDRDPIVEDIITKVREQYEGLNHYYKRCLKFLLVFPINSVIKKRMLFYCWMSEHIANNIASEEDGEECLSTLIDMGFIAPIFRPHNPRIINSLRIPPLIRKELLLLSYQEENRSRIIFDMPFDPINSLPCMSVQQEIDLPIEEELAYAAAKENSCKRIYLHCKSRVCFNVERRYLKFEKKRFMRMKGVVAAQLGRWQNSPKHHIEVENIEFFGWLRSFTELRYLSLRGISRITELPPSIGSLIELRILDLRACHNLERLPPEIAQLKRLIHLDVSECYLLVRIPDGINELSKLEVFKGFVVGYILYRLREFEKLRKLSIHIDRRSDVWQCDLDCLIGLTSLRSLTLTWGVQTSPSASSSDNGMLFVAHNFSPPPNLQKLDIRCFPESEASWLIPDKLTKIERLYIRGGKLASLDYNSPWPAVKILRLRCLHDMDVNESQLHRSFPNLDYLEVHDCKSPSSAISGQKGETKRHYNSFH